MRVIGEISARILWQDKKSIASTIYGVPISENILSYIAQCMIESTNDYRGKTPTPHDIAKLCDMYFALPEPSDIQENAIGFITRIAYSQFDKTRDFFHSVSRYLLLYNMLWDSKKNSIYIDNEIKLLTGLSLNELIAYALSYSQLAAKGFGTIELPKRL